MSVEGRQDCDGESYLLMAPATAPVAWDSVPGMPPQPLVADQLLERRLVTDRVEVGIVLRIPTKLLGHVDRAP
jgi:hypothetical protein